MTDAAGNAAVQVVRGVPRVPDVRSTGEDKGKRHGDVAVAVALAYYASREINKGPVTVSSRPRRDSRPRRQPDPQLFRHPAHFPP